MGRKKADDQKYQIVLLHNEPNEYHLQIHKFQWVSLSLWVLAALREKSSLVYEYQIRSRRYSKQ